jgi:hypothetical protein
VAPATHLGSFEPVEWLVRRCEGLPEPVEWLANRLAGFWEALEWLAKRPIGLLEPLEWLVRRREGLGKPVDWLTAPHLGPFEPVEWRGAALRATGCAATSLLAARRSYFFLGVRAGFERRPAVGRAGLGLCSA